MAASHAAFSLSAGLLGLLLTGCPPEKEAPRETADTGPLTGPWYPDGDGDGYGAADVEGTYATDAPEGYAEVSGDCDDADPEVHPGAPEHCDGLDEDCDEEIDERPVDAPTWYPDVDGDGYGDAAAPVESCEAPEGTIALSGDCDDADADVNPAVSETCNDRDDDCDGTVDDDPIDGETFYPDADGDGYGDLNSSSRHCELLDGWMETAEDCDDTRSSIHPGGTERCNALDDDCDGEVDEDEDGDDSTDSLCDLWQDHGLADADLTIIGDYAYDTLGYGAAFAGDLDGDGDDEIALGANESDLGGSGSGAVYVLPGPLDSGGRVSELAVATLVGPSAGAEAGRELSCGGDVNGDGYEDLWVNSPFDASGEAQEGSAALLLGPLSGTYHLSEPDLRWYAGEGGNGMRVLDGDADYDGDDVPDLVTGSLKADSGIGNFSGKAWIARGDDTWGDRDLEDAALVLLADHTRDLFGRAVAFAGDTTGDGTDDALFTALGEESVASAGLVWIVEDVVEDGSYPIGDVAAARLVGEDPVDSLSNGVSGLGDMNGDGYDDYAIAASGVSTVVYGGGAVYVFYGPTGERTDAAEADAKLTGDLVLSLLGQVGGNGDVDGDGTPDLVAGAHYSGVSADMPGTAWLVPGPVEEGTHALDDAGYVFEGELAEDWAGYKVDIHGDANGDGYAELLVGAPKYHVLSGTDEKWGAAYLYFGQPR